jgi:hypothetical protein
VTTIAGVGARKGEQELIRVGSLTNVAKCLRECPLGLPSLSMEPFSSFPGSYDTHFGTFWAGPDLGVGHSLTLIGAGLRDAPGHQCPGSLLHPLLEKQKHDLSQAQMMGTVVMTPLSLGNRVDTGPSVLCWSDFCHLNKILGLNNLGRKGLF